MCSICEIIRINSDNSLTRNQPYYVLHRHLFIISHCIKILLDSNPSISDVLKERRFFCLETRSSGSLRSSKVSPILGDPRTWISTFGTCDKGVATIDFALVCLPFIALIFAILGTGILFLAQQQLESAVEQSGRLVMTGQVQNQNLNQTQFSNLVCSQIYALFNCHNLMINMAVAASFSAANTSQPTLTFNAQGQVTNQWSYNPGQAGDIVVLQVMYQWPVFTNLLNFNLSNLSNGNHLMMATSVFKNEP